MSAQQDPTDLSGREEDEAARRAGLDLQRRRELDDLRWLMGHAQGRRIAARVLERTGLFRTSFHNSGSVMAFNEGRRDVGLWLTAELQTATPDAFSKLLSEQGTTK